ncbi:MAG: hypothetical protein ABIE22_03560 [archaeon]
MGIFNRNKNNTSEIDTETLFLIALAQQRYSNVKQQVRNELAIPEGPVGEDSYQKRLQTELYKEIRGLSGLEKDAYSLVFSACLLGDGYKTLSYQLLTSAHKESLAEKVKNNQIPHRKPAATNNKKVSQTPAPR